VGTIGNSGMLSFCQNKIITTGEGGAICTNDANIYEKLLLIRSHGRVQKSGENYFTNIHEMDYIQIGYNFRMPTMCAALGISQLNKIDKIIELRRQRGHFYDEKLKEISQIQVIPELDGHKTVYQLYSILVNNPKKREELKTYLLENGIYSKVYFYPIHLKTFYKEKYGYNQGDLPITEDISKRILSLPFSLSFTDEDQLYIINRIKKFFS
jgi:dTDP-4-amino-4,6-dideoxygalactose transaminase